MEILNNFSSIYCFIAFVIGAVLMLMALAIAAMGKDKEPRNKVRFYITYEVASGDKKRYVYSLWMGKPDKITDLDLYTSSPKSYIIALDVKYNVFGLNINDFADMKEGEIREVFINLED